MHLGTGLTECVSSESVWTGISAVDTVPFRQASSMADSLQAQLVLEAKVLDNMMGLIKDAQVWWKATLLRFQMILDRIFSTMWLLRYFPTTSAIWGSHTHTQGCGTWQDGIWNEIAGRCEKKQRLDWLEPRSGQAKFSQGKCGRWLSALSLFYLHDPFNK